MLPVPTAQPDAERAARRILAAVVLIQLVLFALVVRGPIRELFAPGGSTAPHAIGPVIGEIDTHGYYAWLRSPLFDGDWDFTNEYDIYQSQRPAGEAPNYKTPTGRAPNHWSVGPALVWSVAVVPVHFVLKAVGAEGEEPRGYSNPYQLAVGAVTFALSLLTLLCAYRIAAAFAPPVAAATAAGMVVLGTSIVGYGTIALGMAHGPATAALAAYACVWVRTFGSTRLARWCAVGLLLGAACLMRWQLAVFAVLPALEAVWLARENRQWVRPLALLSCAALASVIAFTPQMVAWTVIYGRPVLNPHPTEAEWLAPSFWRVLWSPDRGLFYWTPVALFGAIGLFAASRPGRGGAPQARILLVAVAIQIYVITALVDRGVCLGHSFGFRFLTEACVVLVVGLAVLFRAVSPRWGGFVAGACGAAVCWNLFLLGVYDRCVLGAEDGPAALMNAVFRYIIRRPFDATLWPVFSVVLAFQIRRGFRASEPAPVEAVNNSDSDGFLGRFLRRFGRSQTH
jgi:hypothetical protein